MGECLGMAVGLTGFEIPLFRNPKGRNLLRVPQFGPQSPAYGVLKSPGTPFTACSQGILAVPLLVSILRS